MNLNKILFLSILSVVVTNSSFSMTVVHMESNKDPQSEAEILKDLGAKPGDISGVKLSHYDLVRAFQDLKEIVEAGKQENIKFAVEIFKNRCEKSKSNSELYLKILNIQF